jgi:hypothetical protein
MTHKEEITEEMIDRKFDELLALYRRYEGEDLNIIAMYMCMDIAHLGGSSLMESMGILQEAMINLREYILNSDDEDNDDMCDDCRKKMEEEKEKNEDDNEDGNKKKGLN